MQSTHFENSLDKALYGNLDEGLLDRLAGRSPEEAEQLKREKKAQKLAKVEANEIAAIEQADRIHQLEKLGKRIQTDKGKQALHKKLRNAYFKMGKEPPGEYIPGSKGRHRAQPDPGAGYGSWGARDDEGNLVGTHESVDPSQIASMITEDPHRFAEKCKVVRG